jgi:hypothetical protein
MLVGCIFNTKSGSPQLGGVYVVNGGKSVGGHQQVILSPTPNITGVQQNARMGIALTSLDFNKDGYTDLVVSVPGTDPQDIIYSGLLHIYFGSKSGTFDTSWHFT